MLMKTPHLIIVLLAGAALVGAQGPLPPPPGPPGPTMKTLDQVEPRRALGPSITPIMIDTPGSYYLAGDIVTEGSSGAITISTGDVTLDLNGFAIRRGPSPGGTGITIAQLPADGSKRNITIRNGYISGAYSTGISLNRANNVAIEDVAIQGMTTTGIGTSAISFSPNVVTIRRCRILGEAVDRIADAPVTAMTTGAINLSFARACLIEDCVIANVAGDGIQMLVANSVDTTSSGIVRGCVISRCLLNGIDLGTNAAVPEGLLVEKCTIDQCGLDGLVSATPTRVVDSVSKNNGTEGFQVFSDSLVTGCVAAGNGGNGITAGSDCRVVNNNCTANGLTDGAGILVTGADCVIDGNSVSDNDRGIHVSAAGNLIIKNTASGNTIDFEIVANNKVAPIVVAPDSVAISGSTGGAGVGTTNPWANITF